MTYMREDGGGYWNGRHASEWADAFNEQSAVLQQKAGVNSQECLQVKVVPGSVRTPLERFFEGLIQGLWITPEAGHYFEHDTAYHWDGVREAHPGIVEVVKWASLVGLHKLAEGKIEGARTIGFYVDVMVDKYRNRGQYKHLLEVMGIDKETILPDFRYDVFERHTNTVRALDLGVWQRSFPLPFDTYEDPEEYYGFGEDE